MQIQILLLILYSSKQTDNDSVAQLVEQYTFNVWVLGSNPSGITKGKLSLPFFYSKTHQNLWFLKNQFQMLGMDLLID